ncbi:MAG: EamA family transporter [Candidatus Rokuibacteriota bacterium]
MRAPGLAAARASRSRLTWFGLSLGAALTQAVQFAVIKGRARDIPPLVIVAWTQAVACSAWIVFFLVSGHPFVPPGPAWPAVAASSVLVLGMSGLLARASARGDISIVGPILALSPIFTILPDAMLSGGLPNALGWIGLALSLTGTASLSGGAGAAGPIGRLRALLARRDALDALGAAFLLGFLAAVDRWAALALGPPSYLVSSHGATAALTTLIVLVTNPRGLRGSFTRRNVVTLVSHGLLGVTGTGMQTRALTMAPAAYVNAIRRMSAVVAVLLGRTLFGEPDLTRRLTAALLACLGAACLLLAR